MFTLFQRKKPTPAQPDLVMPEKGLLQPEPAASLLDTPRRQKLLEHIWQRTSLSRKQFITLYRRPLERYAELVQLFPASETHHHAYHGGMLDHGLEIVAFALKLRQSHLLPAGTPPEDQATQSEAWTAAIAYAALLHDIGKIAVDLHIEHEDGSLWHPWHGPLKQPYRFRYRDDREYRLHGAATGLLYRQILDGHILDWLSSYPVLWTSLLYVLAGQYEHAGMLGELVIQADRASVAQELGGNPNRVILAAPKQALQRKLLDGLRYLLKEELKINQPQASDGWLTEDTLWLVSKTVSDKLRAHLLAQGIEGIPSNNTAVFNVLQEHGVLQPTLDGKAIWKATISSASGWSHSFTLLKLSPALIWETSERPAPFTGTVTVDISPADSNDLIPDVTEPAVSASSTTLGIAAAQAATAQHAVMEDMLAMLIPTEAPHTAPPDSNASDADELASTQPLNTQFNPEPTKQPSADHFMIWLREGVQSRKIIINDAKALIHSVDDTAFLVSPGVFQRYAQEHLQVGAFAKQEKIQDWQWIQKRFEHLQIHRKQTNGLNIWACTISGLRKSHRLNGYLLSDPELIFDEALPNNPYLSLISSASGS
ncbi:MULTISPECIES: MobH family relaxase [Pectobacterium]|uniref:Relaxase n=1 Tax=Pectobacterium wasabiae TaxID=55208 RepID=A0AAW3EH31_9GAMM|nr:MULTISPECIES: MobH family relaxase [Pectobacterium]AOR65713.1 relaxase [Pectobacterium wasabiae CFBP 3304]EJS96661.1 Integrating conjugative element relaxase, PFGI-1 class [Pectobacterium wasabiae CFBP 3304]KFX05549.1 relaxase [Pectobacterium wasabiae]KGA30403.1 relaxase [Pectobacterium wasabiae]MCA6968721.1 TraI domain-containing protein [Pectobacterium carotovorum]